ncbi:MAG TPA: MFS transporter [Nocardioidaceae bacterium]|nr:MFS transporter [Actinomycetota bacterium]HEV8055486.1 MFS transporter [Nocardioidaceae bacterium]
MTTQPLATTDEHATAHLQRRTVATLVVTQALGGVGVSSGIVVATVLAEDLLGSASLAGLAQTTQVLGAAVAAFGLARVMARRGRRVGLVLGYGIGGTGAALCVLSAVVGSFALLLLGTLLLGSATATNSQSRYAATDLAAPSGRARALSVVVWATTVGAVLGPNLIGPAGGLAAAAGLPRLTGAFVMSLVGLALGATYLAVRLRPDPLLVAQELDRAGAASTSAPRTGLRHVWSVVSVRPPALAAMAAMALAHAVMVSVMVMTPLHLDHGGASLEVIGFVISVHVLGMFAFSPLVGVLTDRLGRAPVLGLGAGLLLLAVLLAGVAPEGQSTGLTAGLFLLGLGWSCVLIASSALLVDAVPLLDRPSVQGASDLLMGLFAAAGGAAAGAVVEVWGYGVLNALAGVLAVGVAAAALVAHAGAHSGRTS